MAIEYDNNFNNVSDFIDCMNRGCEVEFEYLGKKFGINRFDNYFIIYEFNKTNSTKEYKNAEDLLSYTIAGKSLSEIFQNIRIIFRSF